MEEGSGPSKELSFSFEGAIEGNTYLRNLLESVVRSDSPRDTLVLSRLPSGVSELLSFLPWIGCSISCSGRPSSRPAACNMAVSCSKS